MTVTLEPFETSLRGDAEPGVAGKAGSGCGVGGARRRGRRRTEVGHAEARERRRSGLRRRSLQRFNERGLLLCVGGALVGGKRRIVVGVVVELGLLQAGDFGAVVAGREVLSEDRRDADVEGARERGDLFVGLAVRVDRDAHGVAPPHESLEVGVRVATLAPLRNTNRAKDT